MMVSKVVKSSGILAFLALFLSLFVGTHTAAHAQSPDDWRKKLGKFRVGIVGGNRPILARRQVQPFREVLETALGIPVEVLALRGDRALIDAISTSRIDYTTFSATAFAAAWRLCKCLEPIAAPRAADGSVGFRSVLIARYLGPGSLAALKNKTILIPGKHSFSGFLYPKAALISKDIDLGATDWPVDDKATMQSAVSAFSQGEGDAILGWVPEAGQDDAKAKRGTLHELTEAAADESTKFRILWKSDVLPHGPQVMRRGLPSEAKKIIRQILLGLREKNAKAYDAIEPGFGGGFQSVSVDDYKPLTRILSKVVPGAKLD